ncbi:desmoglein-2-like protein [Conger conger]|uniref:desmoglein-2-like protein n=1 Tax=Conger conger TaxID=82655 RepID=UPI002A5A3EE2|nr:desmoglein-2-like protein [Conger conger]
MIIVLVLYCVIGLLYICGVSPKMSPIFHAGIYLLLLHMLTVLIVKVDTEGIIKLQRQKREWIIPPRRLKENVDYRHQVIAKIRSDEETRTSIRYSLTGHGADKEPFGLFVVDAQNGEVRVTQILDREKTAVYKLQGMAKFANGSQAERNVDLRIVVEDQNDNDPVFSIIEAGAVSELSQTGTFVMRITATDADDPQTANGQVTYSILEQIPGDRSMFYLIKETGEIYVQQSTLDREMHTSYTLKVIGTDMKGEKGGRMSTATVSINILDVNDNVPTLEKSHYEGSVEENTVNVEVMRIKAEDLDLINTDSWRTVFSIVSGNEAGYFAITTDEKTNEGVVTLIKSLDYEQLKEVNLRVAMCNKAAYHSSVVLAQGGSSYPIKIKVKNQPEGPRFSPVTKAVSISENSKVVYTHTVIATYAAIDGDTLVAAENVRYAKLRDPANWLIIDEKTAEIKLNQVPDRESKYLINGTYIAEIICITNDIPAKTATGTIFLEVEDFNDHCPTLTSPTQTLCSYDAALLVSAEDGDADPNGPPFRFRVVPEGTKQEWTVEPANDNTSVILRANEKLWPGWYQVQLDVRDQQGQACDEPQVLEVMVCTCEDEGVKACKERSVPSATFGAPGLGFLLLALLLLLLVPLLLLFCTCGGKEFMMIPFDTKQHLIEYHSERPGEDKEVPLLKVPTEVDSPIQMQHAENIGAGQTMGGAEGVGLAGAAGAGFEEAMGAGFGGSMGAGFGGSMGAGFGGSFGAGFGGADAGYMSWGYSEGMQGSGTKGRYSRYDDFSRGAWDGIALTEDYLEDYYTQKANCAEGLTGQLQDGMRIYEYEGQESPVGSVGCCSFIDADNNLDFLNDLGPKFKTLAEICRGSAIEIDSSTTASAGAVHFGTMSSSSSTTTHTEIAAKTTLTASQAPPVSAVESVIKEMSYTASAAPAPVPRVQVTESVLASGSAYLVQPTPMVYAATPVLQTTRYILEPPALGGTLLLTDRPGSAQGVYVVNEAPRAGEMVLLREQVGASAGAGSLNEGLVLVEQHRVLGDAEAGRGHTLLRVGSPGSASQNLLLVESHMTMESQLEHPQVLPQERGASPSPNLLVMESHMATESQSPHPLVLLQERSASPSPNLLVMESHMTTGSQSAHPQVLLQERGASPSPNLLMVGSHLTTESQSGHQQERSLSPSPNLLMMESQVAMESGHQQVLQQGQSPSASQNPLLEVGTGSLQGGQSQASQNSPAGEEGTSCDSQEETAELQVAAPAGAHRLVRQKKQISFTERSVQEITISSEQIPISAPPLALPGLYSAPIL